MKGKYWKFAVGIGVIVAVVGWLAVSGFEQNKTYYVTVTELVSGKSARQRIRVGGVVADGSIERHGGQVRFRLSQDAVSVPVVYVGTDTLPDTFVNGSQAIIEGNYSSDGVFEAEQVQAKCASKYQSVPGSAMPKKVAQAGS